MADKRLNQRQQDFAFYYAQHGNGTQAAIDAGYSKKTARFQASRLLTNANVQEAIKKHHVDKHMGPEEVMAGLADIARLDMSDFLIVQKDGSARLHMGKAKRARKLGLIREIQTDTETHASDEGDELVRVTKTKVKLYDRQRALETVAKHHGLLKDPEINININVHIELIDRTWRALEEAGLDPVKTFEGLEKLALARITNRPSSN